MLSRSELLARLRGEPKRICPMDMSPQSIACRKMGRQPPSRGVPSRRKLPSLPMMPEVQVPIESQELKGGFFGALASIGRIGATVGRTAATASRVSTTAARAATTAARTGATASRVARPTVRFGVTTSRAVQPTVRVGTTASRVVQPTSRLGAFTSRVSQSTLGRYGLTAYKGVSALAGPAGLGLLVYSIADTVQAKKEADKLASEGDAQAAKDAEELKLYLADLNKAKKDYEDAEKKVTEEGTKQSADYTTTTARQEAEYAKAIEDARKQYEDQAKIDAEDAQAQMDNYRAQQEEQLALLYALDAQRQKQMEDAIRNALSGYRTPTAVPPPVVAPPRGAPAPPPVVAPPPSGRRSGKPSVGSGKRKTKTNQ